MSQSLHACEQSVIGSLMLDNSQLAQCDLSESDFASATHREIFGAIRRLIGAGKVCDVLTVSELLEAETNRKEWLAYAANLAKETLTPSNAPAYASAVRQASVTRRAKLIAQRLQDDPSQESIDSSIRDLMALNATQKDFVCHQSDAIRLAADHLMEVIESGSQPGIPSGLRDLDEALGGFHDGDLVVIAGRPAMGKTALMLNASVAAAERKAVGVFSGEQGREQIGMRLLSIGGPVSLHRMRTANLDDDEWIRITKVMNLAKDRPIWLYDKPAPSIDDIERQARAWKFERNIGIIFVDYLQKISGGRGQDFRLQIGNVCTRLKNLGRELEIPVIALAQVKREVESRAMGPDGMGRMPYMGDIAEAAIIEQESDVIITQYRPEVYESRPEWMGLAFMNICKNRHGPIGYKPVAWRGEYLQFGDLAKTEMQHRDQWSATG